MNNKTVILGIIYWIQDLKKKKKKKKILHIR